MWNGYIRDQLHWAERLAAIALESNLTVDDKMLIFAERAFTNAQCATNAQIKSMESALPKASV